MSTNGKGDKRRPGSLKAYGEGHDRIFGARKSPGKWVTLTEDSPVVEELTPKESATLDEMVRRQQEDDK